MSAQIQTNGNVGNTINGSNAFLDVSKAFSSASVIDPSLTNNLGKGLVFSDTDLTKFEFILPSDATTFPKYFDGMVVYNTGTGKTKTGGNNLPSVSTDVSPGFYYFYNPNGAGGSVTTGVWKPLSDNAWKLLGNSGTNPGTNFIGTTDAIDFIAKTNNQERLRVTSSGNVGIGTTSPAAKLDVLGGVNITSATGNNTLYINGGNTPTNPRLYVEKGAIEVQSNEPVGTNSIFSISQAKDQKVSVLANGNVGIGTSTPKNRLDLGPTAGSSATDVNAKKLAVFNNAAGIDFYGLGVSPGLLQFHSSSAPDGAPGMVLSSKGSVGVGTTTPNVQASLDLSAPDKALLTNRVANTSVITSPVEGMIVYANDQRCFKGYAKSSWKDITPCDDTTPQQFTLNCGNIIAGSNTTYGVSSFSGPGSFQLSYTGGNTNITAPQFIPSASGLIAQLNPGNTISNGSGTLNYTITGTPSASGTATFNINIGDKTCSYNINVTKNTPSGPSITSLLCGSGYLNGNILEGQPVNLTYALPYTGGNGVFYNSQSPVSSQGVQGLTATLQSGTLLNGTGNLFFTITGTPSQSGTASFPVSFAGKNCTFSVNVASSQPKVTQFLCGNVATSGTFTSGTFSSGGFTIPYQGGNGIGYDPQEFYSYGVQGLTAKLSSGSLANGSGNLTFTVSGTPSSSGTANFTINIFGQSCTVSIQVNAPKPLLPTLKCGEAYYLPVPGGYPTPIAPPNGLMGTYNGGTYSFAIKIPYSGGNGQPYSAQYVSSSPLPGQLGGISLILQQGIFANGNGTLDLSISGTIPAHNNNLYSSWELNIGGATCTLSTTFNGK
ncbi:hypothetical protein [Chryseobacterium daeguense]|uniref:hypothetical protein n=1 Tax=Chryseobacterium daeguense TaxID=412438 RepID=UPI0012DE3602|nr:hypothetical protein [Chryseobacterium daeguense]